MLNLKTKKARIILVISYVSLIYLTLPVMRPVLNFLKEHLGHWFDFLTNTMLITALSIIALVMINNRISWQKWILALIVFCLYGYGLILLKIPEERIHLLEYGFLSFLVFRAYAKVAALPSRYWQTFLTVSLVGTIDEIIQYFLPNRVGDIRDVLLNLVSCFLGLLLIYVLRKEKPDYVGPNNSIYQGI